MLERVHRARSVQSAVLSVQLGRLIQGSVFLVMNRSSVRFRQAAQEFLQVRLDFGASPASPCRAAWGRREPNGEPVHHADFGFACSAKMVFMVSAPRVITGLSWCR